jgi:hypothetical protein
VTQPIILWRLSWGEIERVECIRVTVHHVWPRDDQWGGRETRASGRHSYHETWEDARQAALARAGNKLAHYRRELERAQGDYGRIKGMKPPADAEVTP